jgi:hypothetical protein
MSKYPGRVLSTVPPEVSAGTATGIWTPEEVAKYRAQNVWPAQDPVDPNFNDTTMLLHGDGTNGANNNTFIDESPNAYTLTSAGNSQQGTFSPFMRTEGQWSVFLNDADYIEFTADAAQLGGTSNIWVEAWFWYQKGASSSSVIVQKLGSSTSANKGWYIDVQNDLSVRFLHGPGNSLITETTATGVFKEGTWNHVAVSRSGTGTDEGALFLNGVRLLQFTMDDDFNATNPIRIGRTRQTGASYFYGYISNVRYGIGSYGPYDPSQTTCTVPTEPLTAIANTVLLTCQSYRFIDNSSNNWGYTLAGTTGPMISPFSFYGGMTGYTPAANGGSMFLDGTDDLFTIGSYTNLTPEAGDFTVECWFYPTLAMTTEYIYLGTGTGSFRFGGTTNGWALSFGSTELISTPYTNIFEWAHVAVSREGTDLRIFVNGDLKSTVTNSSNFITSTTTVGSTAGDFQGYLSGLRFIKGTAIYTASFSVPTSPPTAISGTEFLCNFTNAGIFDNAFSGGTDFQTVGTITIDTSIKKYGTASINFPGSTSYLRGRTQAFSPAVIFGLNDFTIQFWMYQSSSGTGTRNIFDSRSGSATADGITIRRKDTYALDVFGSAIIVSTANNAFSAETWHFVTVNRQSGTLRIYIDGICQAAGVDATNCTNLAQYNIGIEIDGTGTWIGNLDEFRIIKGVAVDGTIVPTAAFANRQQG